MSSARNSKINSVTVKFIKCKNNRFQLDKNHPYYAQVQGQLYCTRKNCHFVVYTFKDFLKIDIRRDESFIKAMLPKLDLFYRKFFKAELLRKYLYKRTEDYYFE